MQFNVVLPDGSRFGPAGLDTLNDWVAEGRLLQTSTLENTRTGELLLAQDLNGLIWNPQQPQSNYGQPYSSAQPGTVSQQPYMGPQGNQPQNWPQGPRWTPVQRQPSVGADIYSNWSFGLSIASLIACCCTPLAIVALLLGYTARSRGSLQGGAAVAFAWLVTVFSAALWLVQFFGGLRLIGRP